MSDPIGGDPSRVPAGWWIGGDFVEAVLDVVASIPSGKALAYGDVAAELGTRAARAVGQIMAQRGGEVPWWRVVRASGHVAAGLESRALEHFREEGTPLVWSRDRQSFRVDMRLARPPFGWRD